MRFRVLDNDALAKLLELVNSNRRSNILYAPQITTYNGQTASLSDIARSQYVVGREPAFLGRARTEDKGCE